MIFCTVLFLGLALFFCCMAIHLVVWRLFPARRHGLGLVIILVLLPVLAYALVFTTAGVLHSALPGLMPVAWGLAYLLHLSLSGSYLFVYTALVGFSPSMGILEKVAASMPRGIPRHDLAPTWFTDANLSGTRLANMLASGLVVESENGLRLSSRGWVIARCFLAFRRFLGLTDIAQG